MFKNLIVVALFTGVLLVSNCPSTMAGRPQESSRNLGGNQENAESKFLTLGEVDSWVIEAKKNEVIIVRVTTNQFDAIAGLAHVKGETDETDEVLFSIDKDGSNSSFRHRIKKKGKYKIRIHGYEMKGGGNYQLSVQRYVAHPLEIDSVADVTADENGVANFFFDATPGQFLNFNGSRNTTLFDPDGNIVKADWASVYMIKEAGEYLVHARIATNQKLKFEARSAIVSGLKSGDSVTVESDANRVRCWEINAERGQFEIITVSRKRNPESRIILAPAKNPNEKKLAQRHSGPVVQYLPVASKGEFTTYAVVFGRTGKYLLQTFNTRKTEIDIAMDDPSMALGENQELNEKMAVGGAGYFSFQASAGDLVKMKSSSDTFDCLLRLFDSQGNQIANNDDFNNSRNSEISFLAPKSGLYRWQVASLGNGGGGNYEVEFTEIPKKSIAIGDVDSSAVEDGETEYWSLKGEPRQHVYINVRADRFSPSLKIYNSNGRLLKQSNRGASEDGLVAIKVPADGVLTVWVEANRLGGEYDIRVIDADWDRPESRRQVEKKVNL